MASGTIGLEMSSSTAVAIDELRARFRGPMTQAFGLVVPIVSTTGIAGFTVGGGFGHLTRRFGFASDNLFGADVVLADGSQVHACAFENEDLFWGIRGGGGNFGVVTAGRMSLCCALTLGHRRQRSRRRSSTTSGSARWQRKPGEGL